MTHEYLDKDDRAGGLTLVFVLDHMMSHDQNIDYVKNLI